MPQAVPLTVAMVAGEASGDQLAAPLIAALQAHRPELRFVGIGGARMAGLGFHSLYPMETLSVRGYAEAVGHYWRIVALRRALATRLIAERPAVFVGIDASDFNLALEERLRCAGIPTVHYVSPSVWAWRRWRIRRVARAAGRLLALFPFEPEVYRDAGVPVTYVGHPLADLLPLAPDRAAARRELRLPHERRIVALLPGSRRSELQYMGGLFVRTARRLLQDLPQLHFVVPTATRATRELFADALARYGGAELPLTVLFGHAHEALSAADVALVASGTATLEAALCKTPLVIVYRQSPLTWALMRRMLYVPWIGLPNLLAGERIVPEFLQSEANPSRLAEALATLLFDAQAQRRQVERFRAIHQSLRQNAAEKAAAAVLEAIDGTNNLRRR